MIKDSIHSADLHLMLPLNSLAPRQVIFRLVMVILVVEFLIMLLLGWLPEDINVVETAALDISLLAFFTTPLIYFWIIKPFVDDRDVALTEISQLAHTDPLTKLPNRRLLSLHFEKFLAQTIRHHIQGALLLIDLDGFKVINDEHGHDAGDAVLVEVANRLKSSTRAEDVVSRLGGDEFVILIQHCNNSDMGAAEITLRVSEKLVDVIKQPISFNGQNLSVGASIGIRILSLRQQLDANAIIKQADTAMYQAKQAGKGQAVIFDDSSD